MVLGDAMDNQRGAMGLRRSPFYVLDESDIELVRSEIRAIGADERVFVFNRGRRTSYSDEHDIVNIRGDIFPDEYSTHPRDLMSVRAVLAHGHRPNRGTVLPEQSWNDEFRASYLASISVPNLTDEDRRCLVLDAISRAREAGVAIKPNSYIRRVIYGFD